MLTVDAHGVRIPALGFGVFRMSDAEVDQIVPEALSVGFRHFDTAQIYGNEAALGRALAKAGAKRDDLFLTTKVWVENYTTDRFSASVDKSLDKLGVEQVDLLLLHWPGKVVPITQQIDMLNAVEAAGRVRHIGVSNQNIAMMRESIRLSSAPILTNQVELHPYLDQRRLIAAAREMGMTITAYYSMADGKVIHDIKLRAIAERYGKTPAQIVLRWLVQQGVVALSKTANVARIAENFTIFDFELSNEDMAAVSGLTRVDGRLVDPAVLAPDWDA